MLYHLSSYRSINSLIVYISLFFLEFKSLIAPIHTYGSNVMAKNAVNRLNCEVLYGANDSVNTFGFVILSNNTQSRFQKVRYFLLLPPFNNLPFIIHHIDYTLNSNELSKNSFFYLLHTILPSTS